jgi:hypothetical protein
MGMVIEMYCGREHNSAAGVTPWTDLREARLHGIQVGEVSLNSAAMPVLLDWLLRSPLAPLFAGSANQKPNLYFAFDQLHDLRDGFHSGGPDGSDGVIVAIEDALEEARWRTEGLWIGVS